MLFENMREDYLCPPCKVLVRGKWIVCSFLYIQGGISPPVYKIGILSSGEFVLPPYCLVFLANSLLHEIPFANTRISSHYHKTNYLFSCQCKYCCPSHHPPCPNLCVFSLGCCRETDSASVLDRYVQQMPHDFFVFILTGWLHRQKNCHPSEYIHYRPNFYCARTTVTVSKHTHIQWTKNTEFWLEDLMGRRTEMKSLVSATKLNFEIRTKLIIRE